MSKFSIAIPAKNGGDYLIAAVASVLDQPELDVELIVSIDGPASEAEKLRHRFTDSRLRVIQPPRSLSMVGHYEWCLSNMKGDWQTILGQDDALLPNFGEITNDAMIAHPSSRVITFRRAYYFWPGCDARYGSKGIDFTSKNQVKRVTSKTILNANLMGTKQHYDLPQIYTNNIVRREVIEEIRKKSGGTVYQEITPDVYSGVAVALSVGSWARSETPAFLTGTSPSSTGLAISQESNVFVGANKGRALVASHLSTAKKDGYGVSKEIGIDLWFKANVSPIMCISALLSCPYTPQNWRAKHLVRQAFSATIAMTLLSHLPKFFKVKDIKATRSLVKQRCSEMGISFTGVVVGATPALVVQAAHRLFDLLQQGRPSRSHLKVAHPSADAANILVAREVIAHWKSRNNV